MLIYEGTGIDGCEPVFDAAIDSPEKLSGRTISALYCMLHDVP